MISPVIRANLSINQGFSTENSGWENMLLGTNPACRDVLSWDRCINLTAAAGIFHLPTLLRLLSPQSTLTCMWLTGWADQSGLVSVKNPFCSTAYSLTSRKRGALCVTVLVTWTWKVIDLHIYLKSKLCYVSVSCLLNVIILSLNNVENLFVIGNVIANKFCYLLHQQSRDGYFLLKF